MKQLLLLGCILLMTACSSIIFQPSRSTYSEPNKLGIETEDHYIHSSDGVVLHGWRLPPVGQNRGSIIFLHGNAENISSHIGGVYWLQKHGYEVYLFDYRGYGRSTGYAELDGVIYDAQQMIAYARKHTTSSDHRITVMGQSLGGSIAVYALSQLPDKSGINGLITISAFSDYRQITRDALTSHWLTRPLRWLLSFLISNRYRPADVIGEISPIPVFVMHSNADKIIPGDHAQQLFDAAGHPKFYKEIEGTHNEGLSLSSNHEKLLEALRLLNQYADLPIKERDYN